MLRVSGSLNADGPQKTVAVPVTRATSVGGIGSTALVTPSAAGGPAVALPPREATVLHTAVAERHASALEEELDDDTDDDHTALIAPTRPGREAPIGRPPAEAALRASCVARNRSDGPEAGFHVR